MTDTLLKYFQLLYDQIHLPIQVINEEGKIVYVNDAFAVQWGYNLDELRDYSINNDSELKTNGIAEIIRNIFADKGRVFINNYSDSLIKSKETTLPILKTKIFYTNIDGKNYVVLFHEDQTEIMLSESEIKKSRDGHKEAERLKDTFLTVLSHELRTPLNIVLGYSSIIKESMKDKINSEDKIYLDNLYSGSERLYKSITQMLEFAQIEAGNYVMNLEAVELISLIKNSIELAKKSAHEKKLDVKTRFHDMKIFVDADQQSLENAINNILSNAVKFTKHGFIEVEASVFEDRGLAVCKIKDSGVGISSEYMEHLFQPFSQEDLNIGRNYEGNGLGLALAKRYIEKMGGSLLADSIKGVGSTFTFTLPLSQAALKSEEKKAVLPKILLLDDKSESYDLLNAFLKNSFEITSKNIREFSIDYIKEIGSEFIILDISQNNWDNGLKICSQIKKEDTHKRPIIIISSEFIDERIKQFYNAGADKFLVKPFSKSNILKALNR
jgi:two-component system, sensor histidine kinase